MVGIRITQHEQTTELLYNVKVDGYHLILGTRVVQNTDLDSELQGIIKATKDMGYNARLIIREVK